MLTTLAVLCAVGACVVAGRWYLTRVDAIGRSVAFPTVWVVLLLLLAGGAAAPGIRRKQLESRLSNVASELADRPVKVRCQAMGGAFVDAGAELGYVQYRADGTPVAWTLIKRNQCNDLAGYLDSGKRSPSRERVVAVHILTHEAMHLASITNEAEAECAAMQRNARTAQLLGASADNAQALAVSYFTSVYPRMPDPYTSRECRAGGRLDEQIGNGPW